MYVHVRDVCTSIIVEGYANLIIWKWGNDKAILLDMKPIMIHNKWF